MFPIRTVLESIKYEAKVVRPPAAAALRPRLVDVAADMNDEWFQKGYQLVTVFNSF